MATTVKISDNFVKEAKVHAEAYSRSLAKQIEHWAKIGKIAEENPDLSYEFIQGILIALAEEENGDVKPFKFK